MNRKLKRNCTENKRCIHFICGGIFIGACWMFTFAIDIFYKRNEEIGKCAFCINKNAIRQHERERKKSNQSQSNEGKKKKPLWVLHKQPNIEITKHLWKMLLSTYVNWFVIFFFSYSVRYNSYKPNIENVLKKWFFSPDFCFKKKSFSLSLHDFRSIFFPSILPITISLSPCVFLRFIFIDIFCLSFSFATFLCAWRHSC